MIRTCFLKAGESKIIDCAWNACRSQHIEAHRCGNNGHLGTKGEPRCQPLFSTNFYPISENCRYFRQSSPFDPGRLTVTGKIRPDNQLQWESGHAILLIFMDYRSKNRCFLFLLFTFRSLKKIFWSIMAKYTDKSIRYI